jgi:3-phenylpropionate/trans-cinnamate dioxygenase ferredoxin reductase component
VNEGAEGDEGAGTVIVGGGQAGFHVAWALRGLGYDRPVRLVCDERWYPYQRPPLSKDFLHDESTPHSLWLANAEELAGQRIVVEPGVRAAAIDRAGRRLRLADGRLVGYEHLVLATGARNRRLPGGDAPAGVHDIRSVDDALKIRDRLRTTDRIVIVGAGFIGLEVASVATDLGLTVHVVEAAERPMTRVLSETMSQELLRRHEDRGVRFHLGRIVTGFAADNGHVTGVRLDDGRTLDATLVIVAIGVAPNCELAAEAGLPAGDGIHTDERLLTADPRISAIGDCAAFPCRFADGRVRLESVQNAVDQAEHTAGLITGGTQPYDQVPWFWTEQAGIRLQIAGLTTRHDRTLVRAAGGPAGAMSVFCFRAGALVGVESINRPADHMAARRVLAKGTLPSAAEVADPLFTFSQWAKRALAPAMDDRVARGAR